MTWYLRAPGLVATTSQTSCIVCVPDREPARLDGVDGEALSQLLGRCSTPVSRAELETIADGDAIAVLVDLGALIMSSTEADLALPPRPSAPKRCKRIVVGLTGAVASVGALPFLCDLADHFAEQIDVIVGEGAQNFVVPEVFSYYGFRVWTTPFEPKHGVAVPHAELAEHADAVLVAPCSASMIHKLAVGACSDLVSLVVAATKAPVIVAPSTNANMWSHPPVQRNVAQLRADGVWIVEPWRGTRISKRGEGGVGGLGFNSFGLFRILDLLLPAPAPAG